MQRIEKHILNQTDNQSVIDSLSVSLPNISKQKLKLVMKYGAVWLTSEKRKATRVRKAKRLLKIGDRLSIYYDEGILFSDIAPAKLISDEGEYSVWNKPCGMFSQGSKWGDHTSITRWIELFGFENNNMETKSVYLVHRLDRATSGIILVAHSKKVAASLSALFEYRKIEKCYKAVVKGHFTSDLIDKAITYEIDKKSARTFIISSKYNPTIDQSTLLIRIETGRKHQIRKHLAKIGYPIIGDRLYGKKITETNLEGEIPDLMLISHYLRFICPLTEVDREYEI